MQSKKYIKSIISKYYPAAHAAILSNIDRIQPWQVELKKYGATEVATTAPE